VTIITCFYSELVEYVINRVVVDDNTKPSVRMGRKAYRVSKRQPGRRNTSKGRWRLAFFWGFLWEMIGAIRSMGKGKIMYMRIIVFMLLFTSVKAYSAILTVGPGQTYTSITAGISAMSGGDTLLIKDGTYNQQISSVPSGAAGACTIIKAENDGGAIVTGLQKTE